MLSLFITFVSASNHAYSLATQNTFVYGTFQVILDTLNIGGSNV